MESPFVRRLRGALVKEAVQAGMDREDADTEIGVGLQKDIIRTVHDCFAIVRGAPPLGNPRLDEEELPE